MAHANDVKALAGNPIGFWAGKERYLKYDMNAFAELERRFGSINAAMQDLSSGGIKGVTRMLWAGLIHQEAILDENGEPEGYNITPFEVGSWFPASEIPALTVKLQESVQASMPSEENMVMPEEVSTHIEPPQQELAAIVMTPEEEAEEAKNE